MSSGRTKAGGHTPKSRFDIREAMAEVQAALSQNRFEEVERICGEILDRSPGFPPAIFFLAIAALKQGDTDSGIYRLREVVSADPNAFEARELLAKLLRDRRQYQESAQICDEMIRLRPHHPGGYISLGLCHFDQGQALQALPLMRRAAAMAPANAQFHFRLAKTLEELEKFEEAIAECRQAVDLEPNLATYSESLGKLLYTKGDMDEGLVFLGRAVELAPTRNGLVQLGGALSDRARFDEAERTFHQALEYDPNYATTHELLGKTLQVVGRFAEAEASFERAIELEPRNAGPYLAIAESKVFTNSDLPFIQRLEELATSEGLGREDLRRLNYALGKALTDLEQFEEAMRRYDLANAYAFETQLKSVPFNRSNHRQWIDHQIATFTQEFFQKHQSSGSTSERPVFILGMMRSGTTLAEQVLTSHPQVASVGESPFWVHPLRMDRVRRLNAGIFDRQEIITTSADYSALLDKAPGQPLRVTDKMPLNYLTLGLIHLALPNARIIHCRRIPIDTCLSIYTTPFDGGSEFFYNRQSIVDGYLEYRRIMAHWRKVLPEHLFLEIDYEDLVTDQEAVARQMVAFCGLDWDDACLRHFENPRSVRTPSRWQVRQPMYTTSLERWRRFEPWLGEFRSLLDVSVDQFRLR